jgi:hypothetical protein
MRVYIFESERESERESRNSNGLTEHEKRRTGGERERGHALLYCAMQLAKTVFRLHAQFARVDMSIRQGEDRGRRKLNE